MEDFYRIRLSALDHFDQPIARFDREGELTWLNRVGERLLGVSPDSDAIDLRMMFPDPRRYEEVAAQLALRWQGVASDYETSVARPLAAPQEPPIPVRIYAFPETDERGHVAGSVVLLRDLREEHACREIHRAIETACDNAALFAVLAEEIRRLIPCDEFRVSLISAGRSHLRTMYTTDAAADSKYPFRWWQIKPFIREGLDDFRPGVLVVAEMLKQPGYQQMLVDDAYFRDNYAAKVRETQLLPILQDGRIVAFVGLDAERDGTFDHETVALLGRLPVAEAVMAAIHREQGRRQVTTLELIRNMSTMAGNMREAATQLVDCVAQEFGWEHASIFQIHDDPPGVNLVCQADGGLGLLPDKLCLDPAGSGAPLLADRPILYPDNRDQSPFAGTAGFRREGSQLVVPIRGRNTSLALNVESRLANAFSVEETELLEHVAHEAGEVLHRAALFEMQRAVLEAINDAVIETGRDGTIRWCNAAARRIFQIDPRARSASIGDLLDGGENAEAMQAAEQFSRRETALRTAAGAMVPVLLSCSTLPKHLGGKVYIATDYSFQRELQRQSALKEVFRHAAMEGRIPLSLAATWLEQLSPEDQATRETVAKVLIQLGRADLPLERLLRLFSSPPEAEQGMYADLGRAVAQTLSELPASVAEQIETCATCETLPVAADFNHVQFCVESMVAFGLRTRPQSRKLHLSTVAEDGKAVVRVSGTWKPDIGLDQGETERWRRKALYDLTLGESVLQHVAQRVGGRFRADFHDELALALELPLRH